MTSVSESITRFVAENLLVDESLESLTLERPILEEGLLDSLALQRLVSFLESEFDIEIDDDDLLPENFESIQAITGVVEKIRQ